MAVKNYCTMNGQLIGEYEGTRSTDYILDGLGSVIATFRSTGTIQNQYRYSGYGQQVYRSGTGTDPYFLWVGGWGYRTRGMVYVRRRVYYEDAAVWTSVDPLWPWESAYGYANANPGTYVDDTGLFVSQGRKCSCSECEGGGRGPVPRPVPQQYPIDTALTELCDIISRCYALPGCLQKFSDCIRDEAKYDFPNKMANCFVKACTTGGLDVIVNCGGGLSCRGCAATSTGNPCVIDVCSRTIRRKCECGPYYDRCEEPDCAANGIARVVFTVAHEMAHCCGLGAERWWGNNQGVGDKIAVCLENIRA